MKKYGKHAVVEAALVTEDNLEEVATWCGGEVTNRCLPREDRAVVIPIQDGDGLYAHIGAYVIRSTKGEFYPVRADFFEEMYSESFDPKELLEEAKKLRQKVKDQQERLRFLEGATNHAGGFDNFAKLMLENPVDVKPLVMFLMPQLREEVEGLGLALGGGPVLDRTARIANVAKMIAEVVGLKG